MNKDGNFTVSEGNSMRAEWTISDPLSVPPNAYKESPVFHFSGTSMCIRVFPNGDKAEKCISLYLNLKDCNQHEENLFYILGINKVDGICYTKGRNIKFEESITSYGYQRFMRNDGEGIPLATWTVTCRLINQSFETVSQPVLLKEFDTLSLNFSYLLVCKIHSDVTIKVKDMDFQAHKAILAARSSVLAAEFEHDMSETQTGVITIEDCCPDAFKNFLHYLYTGTIEDYSWKNICQLYIIADMYNTTNLKIFTLSHMMKNLTAENVSDVASLAEKYDESELMQCVKTFFSENIRKIILTSEWNMLMRDNYRLANKLLEHFANVNQC